MKKTTLVKVISLQGAVIRRKEFLSLNGDADPDWSFFDAHTEPMPWLKDDVRGQLLNSGRRLTQGELGCYSSHVAVWRQFMESEASQLVVIEDDVIIDWEVIKMLTNLELGSVGINFLKLFNKVPTYQRTVMVPFLTRYHHLLRNVGSGLGTQSYMLTRTGAEVLSAHCRRIVRPIDAEMDRSWSHKLPCFSLFPAPALEKAIGSGIGERRFEKGVFSRSHTVAELIERGRKSLYKLSRNPNIRSPV